MIFGKTFEQQKIHLDSWHKWYAWYPVRLDSGKWCWRETIEYKIVYKIDILDEGYPERRFIYRKLYEPFAKFVDVTYGGKNDLHCYLQR